MEKRSKRGCIGGDLRAVEKRRRVEGIRVRVLRGERRRAGGCDGVGPRRRRRQTTTWGKFKVAGKRGVGKFQAVENTVRFLRGQDGGCGNLRAAASAISEWWRRLGFWFGGFWREERIAFNWGFRNFRILKSGYLQIEGIYIQYWVNNRLPLCNIE